MEQQTARAGAVVRDETAESYNYADFPPSTDEADFAAFPELLKVGQPAPDFDAVLLDTGQRAKLSDFWRKSHLVVEFGSIT